MIKRITQVAHWEDPIHKGQSVLTYPAFDIKMEGAKKSSDTSSIVFIQSEFQNLIPYMTSNSSPSGVASASSSYSSSYYPWKSLDYEPQGVWTGWISTPTGTFTGQWLSYEFDEPITIMAYRIEPQSGNNPDRSPNNWVLQGWNESQWETLDTRSNYTISNWLEETSRKFTVQYPKTFNKFRLYVNQVNGSDAISIRKFEIYSKGNNSNKKSSNLIGDVLNYPDYINKSNAHFILFPNPNNGKFKINFQNIKDIPYSYSNIQDSLTIAQSIKLGFEVVKNDITKDIFINIFDSRGKEVYSKRVHDDEIEIDLQNINKGIYIVRTIVNNKHSMTQKLVIE